MHSTVNGAGGALNTGGVVSSTIIVCVTVAALPQISVTVHVRITVAGHVPISGVSEPTTDPGAEQLSVYPNDIIGGISPTQSTVRFPGGAVKTGGVVSSIVII